MIFGGRSGEHEVSILSAASVLQAANRDLYELIPVGITKDGRWYVGGDPMAILTNDRIKLTDNMAITGESQLGTLLPQPGNSALCLVRLRTRMTNMMYMQL